MPRHSPRPTAGRPPKTLRLATRSTGTAAAPAKTPAVKAPAGLTPEQRVIWRRLAPAALALGTLTNETTHGFRLLVEVIAQRDRAWAVLDAEGLVTPDGRAHPVSVHARQLNQRVESLMARYALTAPGRAVTKPRGSEPENPWAAMEREFKGLA